MDWVRRLGQCLVVAGLGSLILFRGGTGQAAILFACSLLCISCVLACFIPVNSAGIRHSRTFAFWIAALALSYIFVQSWQFEGNPWASRLAETLGIRLGMTHAISVAPDLTRAAVFTTALPFLFYFASMTHFSGSDRGLKLLNVLAVLGGGFAVFGLLQLLLFPSSYFFLEKTAYVESLTGTFVNRNTAGTFLGLASLAALGSLLASTLGLTGKRSIFGHIVDRRVPLSMRLSVLGYLLIFLICLYALFLTKSRGALVAALLGYMFVAPLLVVSGRRLWTMFGRNERAGKMTKVYALSAGILASLLLVLLVAGIFGGQAVYRLERQSLDVGRLCIYSATVRALFDNWFLGTGLGTFEVIFPLYRTADCGFVGSSFLRAHNSYLEGMLGLGLPFIPIFIAVAFHLAKSLVFGLKNRERLKFIPIIGLGGMILVYIHAILDFSLQIPAMAAYFSIFMASISIICLEKKKRIETSFRNI